MTNHRLTLCKWRLSNRCNTKHGMEQLTVADSIQCKFMNCIRMFFRVLFTNLPNHICNLKAAAANLLTSSALETETLNLTCAAFIDKEMCQHNTDTAGIYLGTIYMSAN